MYGGISMTEQNIKIKVYGREQICASCVGAPGSRDTYEWLQAAIGRKYSTDKIKYSYIDIDEPVTDQSDKKFITKMFEEDMFYPIVFVNDEMVAEGIPRLKTIYQSLKIGRAHVLTPVTF